MNTRPVRVAVIGVVAGFVLGGCGAGDASPEASRDPSAATASGSPSGDRPGQGKHRGKDRSKDRTSPAQGGAATPRRTPDATPDATEDATGDATQDASAEDSATATPAPALEMPEAPEPEVSSLSELLPPTDPGPLVTAPLPRAASARGRLVRRFPDALRPTRAARVQSSSVSPSGDRLQVGLVATTALSPAQVLLDYRTRLARRGMAETATPPSVAGSRAAAFRRGDSVVTVTVTARGAGTSYAVHASLRAGRG